MKIYLAGPMRGKPNWNFDAFDEARVRLTAMGHRVYCPAQLFRASPYEQSDKQDREHLLHVLQQDMACLYTAEAIALLPGWQDSVGTTVELATAQFLNLEVLDATTGKPMLVNSRPWALAKLLMIGSPCPGVGHSY